MSIDEDGDDEELVPVFMPALGAILIHSEDLKETPLSVEEVLQIRDNAACIMMRVSHAQRMDEQRGYQDLDPENLWYEWQQLRRELGRKPDIDPGPKFNQIDSSHPAYQQTIRDARASLDQFRAMLPADGSPRPDAMVKTRITAGDYSAAMWLTNARRVGASFVAEFFEVPAELDEVELGDERTIAADAVLDWSVNDAGVLYGGFSMRYYRDTLPEEERAAYDQYVGVTRYA